MLKITPYTRLIIPLLIVISLALVSCQLPFGGMTSKPQFTLPTEAQDVTLTDQNADRFRMSQLRGKVIMLFFGYTHCPDVCPTTLATWKQVESKLGDDAEKVAFVFITVDPERDGPERLKKHLNPFGDNFIGLTGSYEELMPVYQAYNVYHDRDDGSNSAAGYLVSHTASSFLVNPEGENQTRFKFGTTADEMVAEIQSYLQ